MQALSFKTAFDSDTIEPSATQPESRSIEEEPGSQWAYSPEKVLAPREQQEFSRNTAVGHIAVNFGEGKVAGLPVIQESPS